MPPEDDNQENEIIRDVELPTTPDEAEKIENIIGFFPTMDSVPEYTPEAFHEQIVVYKNGSTRRLYWYDDENGEWVYVGGST